MKTKSADFSDLQGKTITSIYGLEKGSGNVMFVCSDGTTYNMFHYQDCCEQVDIEDIAGNVEDLIGTPITLAYEATGGADGGTYTFYHIGSVKGYVCIRWLGTSNGYYSEKVDFEQVLSDG